MSAQSRSTEIVAATVGDLARRSYRDIFAGIKVDGEAGQVVLYVTDPGRAEPLVARGLADVAPIHRAATSVQIRESTYSRPQMEQAAAQIWAAERQHRKTGVDVYSIVLPSEGRGLEVRTNNPKLADILTSTAVDGGSLGAADHIDYVMGRPVHPLYARENPSAPYEGGIPTRRSDRGSNWDCTAAFGVRKSSGTEYLLTAEHCYAVNNGVDDMNGDSVGTVRAENNTNDAAIIETNSYTGVRVNDDYINYVRSSSYSYDGELVCQSGYTSYPNRCQIEVVNAYMQWDFGDGKGVRVGVEGHKCSGCNIVAHGDSDGPVWSVRSQDGYLAARGIVSGGHTPVEQNVSYDYIMFTEVPAALIALDISLQTS